MASYEKNLVFHTYVEGTFTTCCFVEISCGRSVTPYFIRMSRRGTPSLGAPGPSN
jgi:hypothetical protein